METTVTKPATRPVPDLTTKQVALALYDDDSPTAVKRVQRLINKGDLQAQQLPGKTGAYLVKPASVRAYQQKHQPKHDKKAPPV